MIALKEPQGVSFDETEHIYTYEKKVAVGTSEDGIPIVENRTSQLSGVTALLGRQLFKDKYEGISKGIMEKAAERGNLIHRQVEMFETFGGENLAPEVEAYKKLKAKGKYETVATEWLVSDREHVASSIDVVFEKDGEIILCDIKTTSKLDMEYLSWQLSIYKYLLLLDNPKVKVNKLVACWLPKEQYGKPKMVEVEEKPAMWVKELIACDARGEQWQMPEDALEILKGQALVVPQELTEAIAQVLIMESMAKACKEKLRALMEEHGITKWENEDFVASLSPDTETTTFDSKAFKADNPEEYEKYLKTSTRKGAFKVKLKN